MNRFTLPVREDLSEINQTTYDNIKKKIGFMPNLYMMYNKNENALNDYLVLQNRKSTLTGKEKEVVNLINSQINGCVYCVSAHTMIAKMNGFTDDQAFEIRKGTAGFDPKLDALAKFTASMVANRGKASEETIEGFFNAGYNQANMIDVLMVAGDNTISNYLHRLTEIPIDWPIAPYIN